MSTWFDGRVPQYWFVSSHRFTGSPIYGDAKLPHAGTPQQSAAKARGVIALRVRIVYVQSQRDYLQICHTQTRARRTCKEYMYGVRVSYGFVNEMS